MAENVEITLRLSVPTAERFSDDALRQIIFDEVVNFAAIHHQRMAGVFLASKAVGPDHQKSLDELVRMHETWVGVMNNAEFDVRRETAAAPVGDAAAIPGRPHYRISRLTTGEFDLSVRVILLDFDLEDIDEVYETDNEEDARAFIRQRNGVLRVEECVRCHEQQHIGPCMVCHNVVLVGANIEP